MTDDLSQQEVIAFLSRPDTYGVTTVERMSTHGAHIFLAGDYAYKLKRAIKLPFMDYSTVERRHNMLGKEFDINRATAQALYISVKPIIRNAQGALAIGGHGEILDWVLTMRRFDQHNLFDDMARRGALRVELMDALADVIVDMHQRAPIVQRPEGDVFERVALDHIPPLRAIAVDQTIVGTVEQKLAKSCAALKPHLQKRTTRGFVRRCHGDLYLRNIVLIGGQPIPFDALEFDPAFATGDVYYDLAFLLMDLDHRGLRGHANRVLNRYVAATDDIEGLTALPLFLAGRAVVRAKVSAISAGLGDGKARGPYLQEALAYLNLADTYLPPAQPRLIAVGGLSGTGKTRASYAFAPELAPAPGAIVLRSDFVRKRLHGVVETTRLPKQAYEPSVTDWVYSVLAAGARRCLEAGFSCVLDAVFALPVERQAAEALADELGVPFVGCWLEAPLDVRQSRVKLRVKDASDADSAIAAQQEYYDLGEIGWHRIDAGGDLAMTMRQLAAVGL